MVDAALAIAYKCHSLVRRCSFYAFCHNNCRMVWCSFRINMHAHIKYLSCVFVMLYGVTEYACCAPPTISVVANMKCYVRVLVVKFGTMCPQRCVFVFGWYPFTKSLKWCFPRVFINCTPGGLYERPERNGLTWL